MSTLSDPFATSRAYGIYIFVYVMLYCVQCARLLGFDKFASQQVSFVLFSSQGVLANTFPYSYTQANYDTPRNEGLFTIPNYTGDVVFSYSYLTGTNPRYVVVPTTTTFVWGQINATLATKGLI